MSRVALLDCASFLWMSLESGCGRLRTVLSLPSTSPRGHSSRLCSRSQPAWRPEKRLQQVPRRLASPLGMQLPAQSGPPPLPGPRLGPCTPPFSRGLKTLWTTWLCRKPCTHVHCMRMPPCPAPVSQPLLWWRPAALGACTRGGPRGAPCGSTWTAPPLPDKQSARNATHLTCMQPWRWCMCLAATCWWSPMTTPCLPWRLTQASAWRVGAST